MTVREMGRLGGLARAARTTERQRQRWARRGGNARAERHSPEELRASLATPAAAVEVDATEPRPVKTDAEEREPAPNGCRAVRREPANRRPRGGADT
jgi:hypothetical protein